MNTFAPIAGTTVIGITGAARAGKDSLACALLRLVPGAERCAVSDFLSARARLDGRMTTRDPALLQGEGKGTDRVCVLAAVYGWIEDHRPPLAIITGIRKPDEAKMIRAMGGSLVRVVRTERDGTRHQAADRNPQHEIERDIDGLDDDLMVAAPSGDLDTLQRFACVLVGDVLGVPVNVP